MLAVKDMDSLREEFLAGKLFQLYTDLFMTHTISKYSTRINKASCSIKAFRSQRPPL